MLGDSSYILECLTHTVALLFVAMNGINGLSELCITGQPNVCHSCGIRIPHETQVVLQVMAERVKFHREHFICASRQLPASHEPLCAVPGGLWTS